MNPDVKAFFDEPTNTVSYVVREPGGNHCAIIDSVLDYDPKSGRTQTGRSDSSVGNQTAGGHQIEALVLNCMDYRLVDEVTRYLDSRGLRNQYDQLTLAGAAIGVMTDKRSAWGETFWEHVALARALHGINKIIVIDHRDCGACKAFVDAECATDRISETDIHRQWLTRLASEINVREPTLDVELLLMDLDGSVEEIAR